MAAEQYEYYHDPSAYGYGYDETYGYNEIYGYDGYGLDIYNQTPPPTPDENWKDPLKINKTYLKKIQKVCVQKEYYGLKEDYLYLLETLIESITLKGEVKENKELEDMEDKHFIVSLKLLDFPTMKVKKMELSEHTDKKTVEGAPSLSDLFQTMFSATGRHLSIVESEVDKSSARSSENRDNENNEATTKKTRPLEIMQGRSIMFVSSGLAVIQTLQQYPVKVSVARQEILGEENKDGVEVVGTTSVRLPENFHRAVLGSIESESTLPVVVTDHGYHKLVDAHGEEVGEVMLTIAMKCFGKAVLNCIRGTINNRFRYENTTLLRNLESQELSKGMPAVNPSLALELIRLAPPQRDRRTSTEVLQHCLFRKLVEADEKTMRRVLKCYNCDWHIMAKNSQPKDISSSVDVESFQQKESESFLELRRKHKQICRELKKEQKEIPIKRVYEQLEQLRIQTGLAEIEANNPSQELAPNSLGQSKDELDSKYSYESNRKPTI